MKHLGWILGLALLPALAWAAGADGALVERYQGLRAERQQVEQELAKARERLRREGGSLAEEPTERPWWDLPTRRRREGRLRGLDLARRRLEALEARWQGLLAKEDALGAELRQRRLKAAAAAAAELLEACRAYDADRLARLIPDLEDGVAEAAMVEAERQYFRDLKQVKAWEDEAEIALKILKE